MQKKSGRQKKKGSCCCAKEWLNLYLTSRIPLIKSRNSKAETYKPHTNHVFLCATKLAEADPVLWGILGQLFDGGSPGGAVTWQVRTSDSSRVRSACGAFGWAGSHFLQMAPGVSKAHFEASATDQKDYWILFSVCDNYSGVQSCRKWLCWLLKLVLHIVFLLGSFSLPFIATPFFFRLYVPLPPHAYILSQTWSCGSGWPTARWHSRG